MEASRSSNAKTSIRQDSLRGVRLLGPKPDKSVDDVARDQGVSKDTFYAWMSKYGGTEVSEARRSSNRAAQETFGRFVPRQRNAAIGDLKPPLDLVDRKAEVRRLREEFPPANAEPADKMDCVNELPVSNLRDDSELYEPLLAREPATVNSGAPRVVTRCHSWSVSL